MQKVYLGKVLTPQGLEIVEALLHKYSESGESWSHLPVISCTSLESKQLEEKAMEAYGSSLHLEASEIEFFEVSDWNAFLEKGLRPTLANRREIQDAGLPFWKKLFDS